jgi:hypothetical protein
MTSCRDQEPRVLESIDDGSAAWRNRGASFAKDAVEGRHQRLTDVGGEREFADKLLQ